VLEVERVIAAELVELKMAELVAMRVEAAVPLVDEEEEVVVDVLLADMAIDVAMVEALVVLAEEVVLVVVVTEGPTTTAVPSTSPRSPTKVHEDAG
jgi:hypothetical protein